MGLFNFCRNRYRFVRKYTGVYEGKGIVMREPSVVAMKVYNTVMAVGDEEK